MAEDKPQKWADSKVELAAILGVSRQTLYNWERQPGFPTSRSNGRYLIEEWVEFAHDIASVALDKDLPEKVQWEIKLLRQKWERMEFKFALERAEYTHNAIIADEVRRLASEAIAVLREELESKGPIEQRARNRVAVDKAMDRLHRGVATIQEQFPAPDPAQPEKPGEP